MRECLRTNCPVCLIPCCFAYAGYDAKRQAALLQRLPAGRNNAASRLKQVCSHCLACAESPARQALRCASSSPRIECSSSSKAAKPTCSRGACYIFRRELRYLASG
eukprot:6212387-Pleurochrysis_carterae.AAC.2